MLARGIKPVGIVALGAIAGRSLFGPKVKVGGDRGGLLESPLAPLAAHPSAILRLAITTSARRRAPSSSPTCGWSRMRSQDAGDIALGLQSPLRR